MGLDDLPTLATRPTPDLRKGKSRLQETKAEEKRTLIDDKQFKQEVWDRDKGHCRKCRRLVRKCLDRIPERGEVHHIHGRRGDLRFDSRAALLCCCECHEQLTGRVAEKWIVVGTHFIRVRDRECIDARHLVRFERVA